MNQPLNLDEYEVGDEIVDADQQRIDEWFAARSGKLTCSRFGDLMSTSRSKSDTFSQAGYTYLREVVAERLGSIKFSASAASTSWGHENEAAAVEAYTEATGRDVDYDSHRFVELTKYIGGSPDGLVGDNRTLEIKCPYNPGQHIETLISREIPKQYVWQCVGHCLVTKRPTCDFVSFDPRIFGRNQIVVIEFQPTEAVLTALAQRLDKAAQWIKAMIAKIEALNEV